MLVKLKETYNKLKDMMVGNSTCNCRVGKSYPNTCKNGEVCYPAEGSFCTVCEFPGCKNFC